MARVVVTGAVPAEALEPLRAEHEVWARDSVDPLSPDRLREVVRGADALITLVTDQIDAGVLDAAGERLQVVANVAAGHDNIDLAACAERSVAVTNTPGVLAESTADLAMALVLMTTRRLGEGERLIRSGARWHWHMSMLLGTGLQGARLGVVGLGEIGRATARRARVFGMEVVYHQRSTAPAAVEAQLATRRVGLPELLATSDAVSLHCPLTPATHHLIDAAALGSMRRSAVLVNTARGPVVDEAALVSALRGGTIAAAGLDVFEREPTVHPGLIGLDNVVLLPHLGSNTRQTRVAMARVAADNVRAVLAGGEPLTPV